MGSAMKRLQILPRKQKDLYGAMIKRQDEIRRSGRGTFSRVGPKRARAAKWKHARYKGAIGLKRDASEVLRLAARGQHLCRWMIPRDSYPMTRVGYLQWREALKKFHAQRAGEILREVGYPEDAIERVQQLNLKKNFPRDPEGRVLEDALCLVFLEHQLADLAAKNAEDKMINVIQKTWQKMTPLARDVALKLPYRPREKALLEKALPIA